MTTERSLSDFWRHDHSDDRVLELVSVLRGADNLIGLMGSDIRTTWSGDSTSYTDFEGRIVALDYGPLQGEPAPFPGSPVDEVIGYSAHEGGHCLWSAPGKVETIDREIRARLRSLPQAMRAAWRQGQGNLIPDGKGGGVNPVTAECSRIQNILEDAHVDFRVAEQWPVAGEYIRVAREKLHQKRPIDLAEIARQSRPDRNAVLNLWIAVSLYECDLPVRMSARVRRAMTFLLGKTNEAIAERDGVTRHRMAVDVAAYLYREFPTAQAPLPLLPQPGQAGGQGAPSQGGGSGTALPAPGSGQPTDGDAADGASGSSGEAEDEDGPNAGRGGDADGDEADDEAADEGDGQDDDSDAGDSSGEDPDGEDGDGDGGEAEDSDAGAPGSEGDPSQGQDPPSAGDPGSGAGSEPGEAGNLDDFDDREVVAVPEDLLREVAAAISQELEDLSASVAEALAEDPRHVAATARKADEDPELARRVTARVMSQVQEIRRVFDRQQDAQTRHLTGLERGKLDGRRLARVGAGDLNVFRRRQVLETPDLAVGLLLDVSGSMNGYMDVVEETAAVFAEGLIRKRGVNFAAWTYTGGGGQVDLTRICDRRLGKLCLANVVRGGGTPSGAAIAGAKVLLERMPERRKVLIHFTDGQPDNFHHVVRAVAACREAGIRVYSIGVGAAGGSFQGQYGPGNWEVIRRVPELPAAVARLLKGLDGLKR